jgi:hypothetical protein
MAKNWQILIVEDDPDGQALVAHILNYMQIGIEVDADAEQAGEFLFDNATHYDAVIIDLALPGKDGWELLAEIRSNMNTSNIPCIAVTPYHTGKLREEALAAGFASYFAKPLDATAFARQLESILS